MLPLHTSKQAIEPALEFGPHCSVNKARPGSLGIFFLTPSCSRCFRKKIRASWNYSALHHERKNAAWGKGVFLLFWSSELVFHSLRGCCPGLYDLCNLIKHHTLVLSRVQVSLAFVFKLFLALQHLKKVFKILTNTTVIFLCFQTFYNRKQRTKPYNNSSEVWIASFISLECSKTLTIFWLIQQKMCCQIISLCLIQRRFGDRERFYFSAQQSSTFPERKQIFLLMEEAAWEEKFWHGLKGAAAFLSPYRLWNSKWLISLPFLIHKGPRGW